MQHILTDLIHQIFRKQFCLRTYIYFIAFFFFLISLYEDSMCELNFNTTAAGLNFVSDRKMKTYTIFTLKFKLMSANNK